MTNTEQGPSHYMDSMRAKVTEAARALVQQLVAAENREETSLETFAKRIEEGTRAATNDSEE